MAEKYFRQSNVVDAKYRKKNKDKSCKNSSYEVEACARVCVVWCMWMGGFLEVYRWSEGCGGVSASVRACVPFLSEV